MADNNHHKVLIMGSGPAGLTAALYAARANLEPIIFEGNQPGGQLTITTEVENYPGFEKGIQGPELMDIMRKQAMRFGAISEFKSVTDVDISERPFKVKVEDEQHTADSLIIATGATAKLLGLESEKKYMGFGVSACATCDGFFFKDQEVIVVGGGDSAMEEANYLTKHASKVYLVHRREGFRASKIMLERAERNPKVEFLLNSVIEEIVGEEKMGNKSVTGVKLKNTKTGDVKDMPIDGIFIAIGHKPNTELFEGKLDMDDTGYLLTKGNTTYTNVAGVFAAGDVADSVYRQAVTAAGTGSRAAIDAERWLEANGLMEE